MFMNVVIIFSTNTSKFLEAFVAVHFQKGKLTIVGGGINYRYHIEYSDQCDAELSTINAKK